MKRTDIKKRPLSDTVIASLEPENKEYSEKDSHSLYLFVKPTGAKSWKMRYKDNNGKWTWHGLGSYPTVSGAMARQKVQENIKKLQAGLSLKKETATPAHTFESVAWQWFNSPKVQSNDPKSQQKTKGHLNNHILPTMGKKDIAKITRQEWLNLLLKIQEKIDPKTGKPIKDTAFRVLQDVSKIYRFAITQEIAGVQSNPTDYLRERLDKHESTPMAHLSEQELPKLLADIHSISSPITRIGLLVATNLFLRPSEVLLGRWSEIDWDNKVWHIPAERMKGKKPHAEPLSRQVIELLEQVRIYTWHTDFIFEVKTKNPKDALQRYRNALKKLGYGGEQTLHGFRHIASTKLNNYTDENGYKFDERVIEMALAHKVQGVKGVYNRADYLQDRTKLNQWYSDWLQSITPITDNKAE